MNYGIVSKVLGYLLLIEGGFLLPSLFMAFNEGKNEFYSFLLAILVSVVLGIILINIPEKKGRVRVKDGVYIVVFGWVLASLVGAIPFYPSGYYTTYIDALFEIVSGFTTAGSTVLTEVEVLPRSILFWRSLSHWIGGMGILVFAISVLPTLGVGAFRIFKAESPGPIKGKMVPKIKDTAVNLYKVYIVVTGLTFFALIFCGVGVFDSLIHTFGAVGTGGFSSLNKSVGDFNSLAVELVLGVSMLASAVNFTLYYNLLKDREFNFLKNQEFKVFVTIVFASVLLISLNLFHEKIYSFFESLRYAFFHVTSIISTTGYGVVDHNLWPSFSKGILLLLTIIGGSAGSTAGGLKIIRLVILGKVVKRQFVKLFHPTAVVSIKLDDGVVDEDTVNSVVAFLALYVTIFAFATVLITLDGVDLLTSFSSVAATFSNVGPGLGAAGPFGNFSFYSQWAKFVFTVLMLLGRLEIFTFFALFMRDDRR